MKAVVYDRYGSADELRVEDIERPTPGPGELLVRVAASSVNSWDWHLLTGTVSTRLVQGMFRPKYRVLGSDVVGIVEAVGAGVSEFAQGDEVYGDLTTCRWGGFAEYVVGRADSMALKPTDISIEHAATLPQTGLLALQGLRKRWPIKPEHRILLNGAGGAAGTMALQIAKLFGAHVTCVDRGSKLEMLSHLGADEVIDYRQINYTRRDERYDLIFDVAGHHGLRSVRRALAPGGIYVMTGGPLFYIVQVALLGSMRRSSDREYVVHSHKPNRDDLTWLAEHIANGDISPAIDRTYTLDEVPEALRYFDSGEVKGKLVILH